jgi:hypothetical protein
VTKTNKRLLLIGILPFLHLCVCVAIALVRWEPGWRYLLTADLPASVITYNHYDHPLVLFGFFGTLWWPIVSFAAAFLLGRLARLWQ